MFIDTHCHFDFPLFLNHLTDALQRVAQANIKGLIVPSVSSDRFDMVLSLAENHPAIYAALGLHPIFQHIESDLHYLTEKLSAQSPKLVAIGEVGLDRYILDKPNLAIDWQQQLYFFTQQLKLAKQFDLPLLLHSRHAHDALYHELRQANLPCRGVIHGFSGSYEQAMQFVKLGYYIGVGGVISYPRARKTRTTIAKLPLHCLLLETDAPDMPLNGQQGQPNRPENIAQIFTILTQLRSESAEQILQTITTNTLTLFPRINKMDVSA
ncbi:TatD family hydrolase [Orbaceae bacterium ESL0727]|nr:TatD family hydrolase [Orbaceae bacterium ESL0727]